jgi:hypothetical protein
MLFFWRRDIEEGFSHFSAANRIVSMYNEARSMLIVAQEAVGDQRLEVELDEIAVL